MRRSVIAGALLGLVVLTGTPALASPPDIQQKACEADHGTFTRDQGTKTCTTTTVDPDHLAADPLHLPGGLLRVG